MPHRRDVRAELVALARNIASRLNGVSRVEDFRDPCDGGQFIRVRAPIRDEFFGFVGADSGDACQHFGAGRVDVHQALNGLACGNTNQSGNFAKLIRCHSAAKIKLNDVRIAGVSNPAQDFIRPLGSKFILEQRRQRSHRIGDVGPPDIGFATVNRHVLKEARVQASIAVIVRQRDISVILVCIQDAIEV